MTYPLPDSSAICSPFLREKEDYSSGILLLPRTGDELRQVLPKSDLQEFRVSQGWGFNSGA